MALEPITRQEQIVAGKELEPITRMEKFLKDYGVSNYFGETTVKGDTLTWDGNTEGLVSVTKEDASYYRLSDAVVTPTDADEGYSMVVLVDGQTQELSGEAEIIDGVVQFGEGLISCIPEDNFFAYGEILFEKKGIYVASALAQVVNGGTLSLTIPGYKGFETTVIKPIETKYLPEHLQFGEVKTVVNEPLNITWDGNTEGLVKVDGAPFYLLSNVVLTDEQIKSGTVTANDGEHIVLAEEWSLDYLHDDIVMVPYAYVVFVKKSVTFDGINFPVAGIYVRPEQHDGSCFMTSLTTTEPIEQTKTVVKPLAEQYMPILTSPIGKKFKLSVDDSGAVTATEV